LGTGLQRRIIECSLPAKACSTARPPAAGRELRSDCYSEPAAIIGEERRGSAGQTPRARRSWWRVPSRPRKSVR